MSDLNKEISNLKRYAEKIEVFGLGQLKFNAKTLTLNKLISREEFIRIPYPIKTLSDNSIVCPEALEVELPESVSMVDFELFWKCSRLRTLTLKNTAVFTSDLGNMPIQLDKPTKPFEVIYEKRPYIVSGSLPYPGAAENEYFKATCLSNEMADPYPELLNLSINWWRVTFLVIPDGVMTSISKNQFKELKDLKSLTLAHDITRIEKHAFMGFEKLEEIYISPNLKFIDREAFLGCRNLKRIVIRDGGESHLESIGQYAFEGCNELELPEFIHRLI